MDKDNHNHSEQNPVRQNPGRQNPGRHNPQSDDFSRWESEQEKGSLWGIKFLFWVVNLFGKRIMLLILHPVTLYFYLTAKKARKSSQEYLQAVFDFASAAEQEKDQQSLDQKTLKFSKLRKLHSYQHIYSFARTCLDKILSWNGSFSHANVAVKGDEYIQALLDQKKGAIILTSHMGNLDIARVLADELKGEFKVNAIVNFANSKKISGFIAKRNARYLEQIIPLQSINVSTSFLLNEKLQNGEFVVMASDRINQGSAEKVKKMSFLNKPTAFSQAPFLLTALLDVDVLLMSCLYDDQNSRKISSDTGKKRQDQSGYTLQIQPLASREMLSPMKRNEKVDFIMHEYVDWLQSSCKKYPYQWFNFYDYWSAK